MTKADNYGTTALKNFASRSFTYYTSDVATNSINTPFQSGENLESEYGASNADETTEWYRVASETIGGCGGCGTAASITKNYYYMEMHRTSGGWSPDLNIVGKVVVEDLTDSSGTAISRTIYGLEPSGRVLRRVFIQNPTSSPVYWCESWKLAAATSTTSYRLAEYRSPSAHSGVTTASGLRTFLDPYNGSSWSNDSSTLNSSSGLIELYSYNSAGMRTDTQIKNGSGGTAYYTWAADYGDTTNVTLKTAEYSYPTQTTTRSSGKQTGYSYTFYDSSTHQQFKTITTTLPTISSGQNGSGVATTTSEYYDNLGRLTWTVDGEGYINYYAYHPSMGTHAYKAIDVNPSSMATEVTSGSSGNWDAWTAAGANSTSRRAAACPPS